MRRALRIRSPGGLLLCGLLVAGTARAEEPASRRDWTPPDHGHPAGLSLPGVRAGHMQVRGEWMIGYDYERARFAGLRSGDDVVDRDDVLMPVGDFSVAPAELDLERHWMVLAYGLHERLTLRAVLPWIETEMTSVRVDPGDSSRSGFTTRSSGLGDLDLELLVAFMQNGSQRVHFDVGFTAPTGAIHERDDTPDGRQRLPYAQQPGGGTWNLLSGVTYRARHEAWFWGGQVAMTFRFGENELDYRRGDSYELVVWAAREWTRILSTSLRLSMGKRGTVQGRDPGLPPPFASPADDPANQGARRVDLAPGVQLGVPGLPSHRLALEFRLPVYEALDGPQLESDWSLRTGWRWSF